MVVEEWSYLEWWIAVGCGCHKILLSTFARALGCRGWRPQDSSTECFAAGVFML